MRLDVGYPTASIEPHVEGQEQAGGLLLIFFIEDDAQNVPLEWWELRLQTRFRAPSRS